MNNEKPKSDAANDAKRDSAEYQPIGGLYDDKRDHGSPGTQHADEGTQERDVKGNKNEAAHKPNAGGSPTRSESSEDHPAEGSGNQ